MSRSLLGVLVVLVVSGASWGQGLQPGGVESFSMPPPSVSTGYRPYVPFSGPSSSSGYDEYGRWVGRSVPLVGVAPLAPRSALAPSSFGAGASDPGIPDLSPFINDASSRYMGVVNQFLPWVLGLLAITVGLGMVSKILRGLSK